MQITKAAHQDIPQIKQLWNFHFEKENPGFFDFLLSVMPVDHIYVAKEEEKVVSVVFIPTELEYSGCKGYYLYNPCIHPDYTGGEYITALIDFVIKDRQASGYTFRVMKYAGEETQALRQSMGFDNIVTHRRCELEIKRNIWQSADFDIITASRFRSSREKFCEERIVHYTSDSYGRYTAFMYTRGGSTAESKGAYAVYFVEKGRLTVKEIFAQSTLYATQLLQAIRERTGIETATVFLPENSTLFLGEGRKETAYLVKGIQDDVYINLMFD